MEFGIIFNGSLMNFPFAHPPCKTFKFDDPSNEFACFYTSEEHEFSLCSLTFPIHMLALILMSFDIDFGFVLVVLLLYFA